MDSEAPNIFEEFAPTLPPQAATEAPAPQKRNRRQRAAPKAKAPRAVATQPVVAPKKPGRPRKDPHDPKERTQGVKVDLDLILSATAGMQHEDGALFAKIVAALYKLPKAQRNRIASAIGKVFG